jgi:hypothetical protein
VTLAPSMVWFVRTIFIEARAHGLESLHAIALSRQVLEALPGTDQPSPAPRSPPQSPQV